MDDIDSDERLSDIQELISDLEKSTATAFVGSAETVRLAVLGLVSGLHVLIEDIPGVGKTTLAWALSRAAGLSFSRIQFTPDMLPGDVLGMNVWDPLKREFVFREGPINVNFILADELNRTSPRTQAAFLEAMQEGQVTVDGTTRKLPAPFFLVATQNPAGFAGTFPLPEAELDRFGLALSIGYPTIENENEILRRRTIPGEDAPVRTVGSPERIAEARKAIAAVHVSDAVRQYIVSIVRETRAGGNIRLGASPRAAIYLQQASRARAAAEARAFVIPEDVESLAPAVLSHRVQLSSQARLSHTDAARTIREIAAAIPKPTGL
jgi:MoxR-like ATPase